MMDHFVRSAGLVVAAFLSSTTLAQSPLTTWLWGANSGAPGGAIYFDLDAEAPLAVTSLWLPLVGNGNGTLSVYRCQGGHAGQETQPAAWTLVATATLTGGFWPGWPIDWSTATFATPWTLPAGNHGYALVAPGMAHLYDDLVPQVSGVFVTEELRLTAGSASNVPFSGPVFAGRVPNLMIHYADPGPGFARHAEVGSGCGARHASVYEAFAEAWQFDLSHTSFRMVPHAGGYEVRAGGGVWRAPSAAAVSLGLVDESTAICTFQGVFDYPGGSTSSFEVGSNGTVSAGPNLLDMFVGVAGFIDQPHAVWGVWRDFVPTSLGNVWFEQVGTEVHITFLDVFAIVDGLLDLTPSRFQLQFDTASDVVTFVFAGMAQVGGAGLYGFPSHVVGFSPGGPSPMPAPVDLSSPALLHHTAAADRVELRLRTSARPVRGTAPFLSLHPVDSSAMLAGLVFGLANPQLDLGAYGMPGCTQHVTPLATVLLPLGGGGVPPLPFAVPDAVGTNVYAQGFVWDPAAGTNALSVIASQGLRLSIGSF